MRIWTVNLALKLTSTLASQLEKRLLLFWGPCRRLLVLSTNLTRSEAHINTYKQVCDPCTNRDILRQEAKYTWPYRCRKPCFVASPSDCSRSVFLLIFYTGRWLAAPNRLGALQQRQKKQRQRRLGLGRVDRSDSFVCIPYRQRDAKRTNERKGWDLNPPPIVN